jgi:hypothetical protein
VTISSPTDAHKLYLSYKDNFEIFGLKNSLRFLLFKPEESKESSFYYDFVNL